MNGDQLRVVIADDHPVYRDGLAHLLNDLDGIDVVGVVVLTMFDDDELLLIAVRAGARGYLLKDADEDEIASVLHGIARGAAIFGPTAANRMLHHLARAATPLAQPPSYPFPQLTVRERQVLDLLARGKNNTAIAGALFLSERTVRNYVSMIFTKLEVTDRAQAIAAARDAGIAAEPDGA